MRWVQMCHLIWEANTELENRVDLIMPGARFDIGMYLKGRPLVERCQKYRKLKELKIWVVKMKRDGEWFEEKTFDVDVAAVLEELCGDELSIGIGLFKEAVTEFNKYLLSWFV